MNGQTDQQLLRDFTERRSEAAFTELVGRHVDLVHSAAFRMTGETHSAHDVTQAVFVTLAQNASRLTQHPVLSGWLHTTARYLAAKYVRATVRRQNHEQEAAAMNELLSTAPDASWEEIAPHLDAALGELSEPDRDAVLLRYFEKKSATEIAARLGTRTEAAQKRVSRAVERLREFFTKRGVSAGTGGLAIVISANAVQAAPAGLAATISVAAFTGTAVSTGAVVTTITQTVAMTTIQKTIVTATIVVLAAAGIYEARQAAQLRKQVQTLRQQQSPLSEQIQALQRERDEATNQIAALRDNNERLNHNTAELLKLRGEVGMVRNAAQGTKSVEPDPIQIAAQSWLAKVDVLKKWIEQRPEQTIPEFQYLQDYDWLDAVKNSNMLGDHAPMNAMPRLREGAKRQFAHEMSNALRRFVEAHSGDLPTNLSQLNAYFQQPMNAAILNSYKLLHTGKLADLPKKEWLVCEIAPPVEPNDDRRMMIRTDDFVLVRSEK